MRALKAAVVIMGVLIVAGTIALAVVIANRFGSRNTVMVGIEASLNQPAGSRIVGIAGAGERFAVHLTGGGLPDRILLVEPVRGRVVGTLLAEAPAAVATR